MPCRRVCAIVLAGRQLQTVLPEGFGMKLAIVTYRHSDISSLWGSLPGVVAEYHRPDEVTDCTLAGCDAVALLGGTGSRPLVLPACARAELERCITGGVRVFAEFTGSIDDIYTPAEAESTRFSRLVVNGEIAGLNRGDLLEDQCNSHAKAYFSKKKQPPLLYYKKLVPSHDSVSVDENDFSSLDSWALWLERPNLMICTFKLCDFVRARFSPLPRWESLIRMISEWLTGMEPLHFARGYTLTSDDGRPFETRLRECFDAGIRWYFESGMLIEDGKGGIREGLMTEILPDGAQNVADTVRADCTGEASMAFLADYLVNGTGRSLEISKRLEDFCYDRLQISGGMYDGMLRWSEVAWNVCYQDDNARVIIPSLLRIIYTGDRSRLPDCCRALDFLVRTTGTDGLRVARTDNLFLDDAETERLRTAPGGFPSAHYNAFYGAALVMCGRLASREDFIQVGVRCLESIMAVYPETVREHSETQELCRLILPLAWLYSVTGKDEHKAYLYRVTDDLSRLHHACGAYLEWDTGYKAACSRKENGECSLLAENGDPVVDLLYSVNWLPLGFWQAYLVTGDERFRQLWRGIAEFMMSAQLHSDNRMINGAWARGFDADKHEVYGIPNDVGWGPWAIESGWTVSEILAGLGFGLLDEKHIAASGLSRAEKKRGTV